jgi:uncharacterized integral membrane protein
MKLHIQLLLILLALIAVFAALNWGVFISPTELSLGLATVHMPLGLVMLGLLVLVTTAFLLYIAYLQGSALLETRRHTRELQANRELADKAEASRFTELRTFLAAELAQQTELTAQAKAGVLARIEELERALQAAVEQSGNTTCAYIGELEDRLDKTSAPPAQD